MKVIHHWSSLDSDVDCKFEITMIEDSCSERRCRISRIFRSICNSRLSESVGMRSAK